MKRKKLVFIGGILIAILMIILQLIFIVREGEAVVVTTFGKPVRVLDDAGLYGRMPWPVQSVYRFDRRIQSLEGPFEQILTRDGRHVVIAIYAGWRIIDPVTFLERVGTTGQAERNLEDLLRNHTSATLGRYDFAHLINVNPDAIRFETMETEIRNAVQAEAEDRYGIDVRFLGIHRIALPEAVTGRVFERMRAERAELAEQRRAEGESEARRIRAEADSLREQTLARAAADAQRIRAEGEAEAAESYRVFSEHPELALFLRKLDTIEHIMTNKTTVILGTEGEPFDLLKGPGRLED